MLELPLGGGSGERHVQRMPEPGRRDPLTSAHSEHMSSFSKLEVICLSRALGVDLQTAVQHAVSSYSYLQMTRTPALQQGLSNVWL